MSNLYHQAKFILGATALSQLPDCSTEVAFAGRSNAGKSTALNTITQQRKLARTSRTPGRTREINCFELDAERYLIDLPGYGYAKVPEAMAKAWQKTLTQYLLERQSLKAVFILMDIRHPLTPHDWSMIEILPESINLHFVLTKADKLSRNQANKTLMSTAKTLEKHGIEATVQTFSALSKDGLQDIWDTLDDYFMG